MELTIFDVEHGACALVRSRDTGRLALIDCGHNSLTGWTPSRHIRQRYNTSTLDYLIITNTDEDHYSNLAELKRDLYIATLYFNPDVSARVFSDLKRRNGPLSKDAETYFRMRETYIGEVEVDFNDGMGGITQYCYYNSPSDFEDFNNLSLAVFLEFGDFMILFPGDLEGPGWQKLLERSAFRHLLGKTNVLVAPHHGRINSHYCPEIFEFMQPELVVISDKPIVHETQTKSTNEYRKHVREPGVPFDNQGGFRKVLTTRSDGAIHFSVRPDGGYHVTIGA